MAARLVFGRSMPPKALVACLLASAVLLFSGCGSLRRSIGFGSLSEDEMRYAATLPADQAPPEGRRWPIDSLNSAQYIIPAFPLYFYAKQFSRLEGGYSLMRSQMFLLISAEGRMMFMNRQGLPLRDDTIASVLVLGGVDTITGYPPGQPPERRWRVRILEVPIVSGLIGPCFGFGTGYVKALWIPFVNKWRPRRAPAPPQPMIPATQTEAAAAPSEKPGGGSTAK